MTETAQPTPREIALQEALSDTGIPLHRGGLHWDPFNPYIGIFSKEPVPVVAIWSESEIPTGEEISTITKIAQDTLDRFFAPSEVEGLFARGANTITLFKKAQEIWTFRKMTWDSGPIWYPISGPLNELAQRI